MAQQLQIDTAATMTNGSTAVVFSHSVTSMLGVEAGAQVVMPSDPPNVYIIATVADDGLSCVLSTPFAGASGATPFWLYDTNIAGMMILGSAPLTSGATSIMLKADMALSSEGPIEIMFASQPYQFSLVFAVPYMTTGPINVTAGSTMEVAFEPAYSGPSTTGSVNVGLVGFNG